MSDLAGQRRRWWPFRRGGGEPFMTRGARYSAVFLAALTFALSGVSYHLAVSAVQGELASRASAAQLCQSGNEARAQQVTLWTHIIAISAPPARQTPAQQRQRQASLAAFLRYIRVVFAPRDCPDGH